MFLVSPVVLTWVCLGPYPAGRRRLGKGSGTAVVREEEKAKMESLAWDVAQALVGLKHGFGVVVLASRATTKKPRMRAAIGRWSATQ